MPGAAGHEVEAKQRLPDTGAPRRQGGRPDRQAAAQRSVDVGQAEFDPSRVLRGLARGDNGLETRVDGQAIRADRVRVDALEGGRAPDLDYLEQAP